MQQPFAPNQYQLQPQPIVQPMMQQPIVVQQPVVQPVVQQPIVQQPEPTKVVVEQKNINTTRMGEFPVNMTCPSCKAEITTRTRKKTGLLPWLSCVALMAFGFNCGCCIIPFFATALKDTHHKCPQCGVYIGKHPALGCC